MKRTGVPTARRMYRMQVLPAQLVQCIYMSLRLEVEYDPHKLDLIVIGQSYLEVVCIVGSPRQCAKQHAENVAPGRTRLTTLFDLRHRQALT